MTPPDCLNMSKNRNNALNLHDDGRARLEPVAQKNSPHHAVRAAKG